MGVSSYNLPEKGKKPTCSFNCYDTNGGKGTLPFKPCPQETQSQHWQTATKSQSKTGRSGDVTTKWGNHGQTMKMAVLIGKVKCPDPNPDLVYPFCLQTQRSVPFSRHTLCSGFIDRPVNIVIRSPVVFFLMISPAIIHAIHWSGNSSTHTGTAHHVDVALFGAKLTPHLKKFQPNATRDSITFC